MWYDWSGICCPKCGGALTPDATCILCGEKFNVTMGIPDLRWPRPITSASGEEKLVASLSRVYHEAAFDDLMTVHFRNAGVSGSLLNHYREYRANSVARSNGMLRMFEERLADYYDLPNTDIALDVGCGVGTGMAILAEKFKWVVGIDIFLSKLILARKFLEESRVDNFVLVQARAQNLPFLSGVVDYAVAQNVIEHLMCVEPAFHELRRVLKTGGCFCGDSRNRFDLFFPEPHVQLRWVGFWPRKFQPWYVRKFRGVEYESTRLLSLLELSRSARCAFGEAVHVVFPYVSAYGKSSFWNGLVKRVESIPLLRDLLLMAFPSHVLLAKVES